MDRWTTSLSLFAAGGLVVNVVLVRSALRRVPVGPTTQPGDASRPRSWLIPVVLGVNGALSAAIRGQWVLIGVFVAITVGLGLSVERSRRRQLRS